MITFNTEPVEESAQCLAALRPLPRALGPSVEEGKQVLIEPLSVWIGESQRLWVLSTQPTDVPHISLGGLVALVLSPFLVFALVSFVVESVFGGRESTAGGVGGAVLISLAVIVPADLNRAVAVAIWQELGWRIGFELVRPVALYWGLIGIVFLLGGYAERQESTTS